MRLKCLKFQFHCFIRLTLLVHRGRFGKDVHFIHVVSCG